VKRDGLLLALMLFAPVSVAFALATILSLNCATVPPAPSCSEDPTQAWCYPPLTDQRARDGGR
jgi:hypothetical protein